MVVGTVKSRVRAVIRDGNKLLLVQHRGYRTWCLPGGGIEKGESLKSALEREIMEELGVQAQIGELLVVHQFKKGDSFEGPEFFFEVTNADDFKSIDHTKTSHGQTEIEAVEFKDTSSTKNLLPAFLDKLIVDEQGIKVVLEDE